MTGFSRCGMDNTVEILALLFQLHTGIDQIDDAVRASRSLMNTRGIRPAIGPIFSNS